MSENIEEIVRVRDRGEFTIPKNIREHIGLNPGDYVGIQLRDNGDVCLHKVEPKIVRNNSSSKKLPKDEAVD